jgi:multicomponent Na+:H+ antiporter subunit E
VNDGRTLREFVRPRRLLTLALLIGAWCAAWGEVSVANVLSGAVVAVAATLIAGIEPGLGRIRIVPLLQFLWLVAVDLVVATATVAWEVLTPTDSTNEAIVGVDTSLDTRSHLLMLVVAITVTPGTAVVDMDVDTGRLYLHVLHANRLDATEAHVRRLAELACRALPVDTDAAADRSGVPTGGLT